MTAGLKDEKNWRWTDEMNVEFENGKEVLANVKELLLPDYNKKFLFGIDASNYERVIMKEHKCQYNGHQKNLNRLKHGMEYQKKKCMQYYWELRLSLSYGVEGLFWKRIIKHWKRFAENHFIIITELIDEWRRYRSLILKLDISKVNIWWMLMR